MANSNIHRERDALETLLKEEFKIDDGTDDGECIYRNKKNGNSIKMNLRGSTSGGIYISYDEKYDYYLGNNNKKYCIVSKAIANKLYKRPGERINIKQNYSDSSIGKIWYDEKEFMDKMSEILGPDAKKNKVQVDIEELIEGGAKQIILTGAPGTGKTYMARKVAEKLGEEIGEEINGKRKKYKLVQFHPSYDYTDFVEGLRPVEGKKDKVEFKKVDGIFKKFCREVVRNNEDNGNKGKKYFFIIDEINRADLSKVFGELMYGLETDKRGEENSFYTQYQNLKTYDIKTRADIKNDEFEGGFYIPENVYIIGTMNDIDRSVESMDFALRRRFLWKEIKVEDSLECGLREIIKGWKKETGSFNAGKIAEKLKEKISNLNNVIKDKKYNLGEQYCISQGQFANLPEGVINTLKTDEEGDISEFLKKVWDLRIKSLLYEYVRGEGIEEEFLNECGSKWGISSNKENE